MRFIAVGVLGCLLSSFVACVGDDPVGDGPSAEAGAPDASGSSSSGASSGAPIGDDASSNEPRALGVFLTSTPQSASFARALGTDPVSPEVAWELVDQYCRQAAAAVPLPRHERYHALVVIADKLSEATPLTQFRELPRATDRWCSISPSTREPSCAGTGVVFDEPTAIARGPVHSLFTSELGTPVANTSGSGRFWSGVSIAPGGTVVDAEALTCDRWSNDEVADGAALRGGVGSAASVAPGTPDEFGWLGAESAPCAETRLPLLCIEIPPAD